MTDQDAARKLAERMADDVIGYGGGARDSQVQEAKKYAAALVQMAEALEHAKAYIPCSEVRSWPPGFDLKDTAMKSYASALSAYRALNPEASR